MTKTEKLILGLGGILVIVGLLLPLWLYTGTLTPAKRGMFRFSHLPIAVAGGSFISLNEVETRALLAGSPGVKGAQIFQNIIDERATEKIAARYGIAISAQEVRDEYNNLVKQQGGGSGEFRQLLKSSFGMTPEEFQIRVLLPQLRLVKLNIWHNSQRGLDPSVFNRLEQIRQELFAGRAFAQVVKKYSDDQSSRVFSGDSGFIDPKILLPELQEGLANSRQGDIIYLTSRYGQHVIKILGKDNSQLQLQSIFLRQDGFSAWHESQLQTVPVRILVRLN